MSDTTKDAILARASKPAKEVPKVLALRLQQATFTVLKEQADLAGVKPSDIARAAIEQFCSEV